MTANTTTADPKAPEKSSGGAMRSPNFPAISLPDALKRVKTIYDADGRAAIASKVVLEHLGYGAKLSGAAGRMVSALRQYGLLQDMGGEKYRVTDDAFHLLTLSEAAPQRKAALEKCAQKPQMFREVLTAYPDRLPSDSTLRDYLITDKKFNPASVETFIRALKGTLEFAKLTPGAYTALVEGENTKLIAVGDFVQWESQGVLQFEAKKVTAITPDRTHLFVEGTATGIPMEQVQKVDTPSPKPPALSGNIAPSGTLGIVHMNAAGAPISREVSAFEEGEASLVFPAAISPETVDELEDWLKLVVKKLRRRYGQKASDE